MKKLLTFIALMLAAMMLLSSCSPTFKPTEPDEGSGDIGDNGGIGGGDEHVHAYGEWSFVSSNETHNTYIRTCQACGHSEYKDEPIPPQTHKWDQNYEILFHTLYNESVVALCCCEECDYTLEISLPALTDHASYHSYEPGNCQYPIDNYSYSYYTDSNQDFFGTSYVTFSFKVNAPYEHDAAPAKEDCTVTEGVNDIYYVYFCTRCDHYVVAYSEPKQPTVNTSYLSFAQIDGGLMVTGLIDKSVTDVVIPASYQGKDVIAIGDHAFFESNIQTISIPHTVTDIGHWALYCCTSLYSITVDDSNPVYRSYNGDLYNEDYSELIQYAVGKTDTSYTVFDRVKKIAESAFAYGLNLTSVRIANNVKEIGRGAFFLCYNITDVVIPAKLTDFDGVAFTSCISLAQVFYGSDEKNWNTNSLSSMLDQSNNATIYFYSETKPTEEGSFWHYVDGVPTVWDAYVAPEAPEYSEGLIFTLSDDSSYYTLDGIGSCTDTEIYIPPTYNGLPVKAIGDYAFRDCAQITKVAIPEGVTRIGTIGGGMAMSFRGCTNLETVIIPDSMSYIGATAGESAFYNCNKLWTYENGVYYVNNWAITGHYWGITSTSYPETTPSLLIIRDGTIGIGNQAFIFGEYTEVIIPSSLKYVCQVAFMNWYSVERIYYVGTPDQWSAIQIDLYNDGLTDHPVYFYSETAPTTEGNFWHYVDGVPTVWDAYGEPETPAYSVGLEYTSNGDGTCYVSGIGTCTDTDIVIPEVSPSGYTVVGIGVLGLDMSASLPEGYAFRDCKNITYVQLPDTVTYIGDGTFYGCTNLVNIKLSNNLTTIGMGAIGCESLRQIELPDSLTTINSMAFIGCASLTSITLGKNVESIGSNAFIMCVKLVEVINHSSLNIVAGSSSFGSVAWYAMSVHNGKSKITSYGDYTFYVDNRINYLVCYNGNESNLVLPESYNGENYVIHNKAFYSCGQLTSVTIPNSVTAIGDYAFSGSQNLQNVIIGNGVSTIGNYAFEKCSELKDVYYTDSEDKWNAISIGYNNFELTNRATKHYNYAP